MNDLGIYYIPSVQLEADNQGCLKDISEGKFKMIFGSATQITKSLIAGF